MKPLFKQVIRGCFEMKKSILIALVLVSVFLVAGCSGQIAGSNQTSSPVVQEQQKITQPVQKQEEVVTPKAEVTTPTEVTTRSLAEVENIVKTAYGEDMSFDKADYVSDRVRNNEGINKSDYGFYYAFYVTIIEIKNKEKYLKDFNDFETFAQSYSQETYNHFLKNVSDYLNGTTYDIQKSLNTELINLSAGQAFRYEYRIRVSNLVYDKDKNISSQITNPYYGGAGILVYCSPNYVIENYDTSDAGLATVKNLINSCK